MKIPAGWPDQWGRHFGAMGAARYPVQGLGGSPGHSPQSALGPMLCVGSMPSTQQERASLTTPASSVLLLPSKPALWGLHRRSWGSWGPPRGPDRPWGLLAWFRKMEHCKRLCSESKRRAGWASSRGWRGLHPCWPERWPTFLTCDRPPSVPRFSHWLHRMVAFSLPTSQSCSEGAWRSTLFHQGQLETKAI
uniref:Uncharacterized protein n=1 Tax=Pan paniscus TaxID=9597 RepID=A0A2R8ZVD4_PANPA